MQKDSRSTASNQPRSMVMLITSMIIFGTIGIFRRAIPLSSATLAFWRGIIGCLFLMIFSCIRHLRASGLKRTVSSPSADFEVFPAAQAAARTLSPALNRPILLRLIVSGILIDINWILLFEAYNYTTVSTATLCYYMEPTIVVLLAAVLLHERLTPRKALCTLAALIGMVLVSGIRIQDVVPDAGGAGAGAVVASGNLTGVLLGLAAACLYASVVLINKTLPRLDPYRKTMIQLASASICLIPYLLLTSGISGIFFSAGSGIAGPGPAGAADYGAAGTGIFSAGSFFSTLVLLLLVGIVHTGFSYALYFGSMDGLRTQTVALFSYIDPVTALLLSALLLGERLTPAGIIGAILILGSAIICESDS